jgi:hypothetical protein
MATSSNRVLRPDKKGRITLGKFARPDVSGYQVKSYEDGRIVLEPVVEIPAREAWLWKNDKALASVKKGLEESASGKAKTRGTFSKFVEHDDE